MKSFALCMCFVLAGSVSAQQGECAGTWSARGKRPHVGDAFTSDAIASPDKRYTVDVTEDAVVLSFGTRSTPLAVPVNTALMEIVWAPNSKAFAINVSEGDHTGRWRTFLFSIDANHAPHAVTVDDAIKGVQPNCARESNVALAAWLEEGREALLVFEARPEDTCQSKGLMAAASVDLVGGTVKPIPEADVSRRWGMSLGCRLRQ